MRLIGYLGHVARGGELHRDGAARDAVELIVARGIASNALTGGGHLDLRKHSARRAIGDRAGNRERRRRRMRREAEVLAPCSGPRQVVPL